MTPLVFTHRARATGMRNPCSMHGMGIRVRSAADVAHPQSAAPAINLLDMIHYSPLQASLLSFSTVPAASADVAPKWRR